MPVAPVARMKKSEIVYLGTHLCKHSHTYLEHYQCYLNERPRPERKGYFDIETFGSNFNADTGFVLCYCIKAAGKNKICERSITRKEINTGLDKALMKQLIEDLKKFDRLYTWFGSGFDFPFIRARALKHGLKFLEYGERFHKDLYYVARAKLKIRSRSLENVAKLVLGKTRKTRFDYDHWLDAVIKNDAQLNKILEHCRYDVRDLEDVHKKLEPFYMERDTSV